MMPPPALATAIAGLVPGARLRLARPRPPDSLYLWLLDPEGMARPLTEPETDAVWETPPYWSFCWGAGRVLAAYLLANPALVAGRTVLDFGCGSGVVGIAAARAGARRVVCCDSDPVALQAAAANAALNAAAVELTPSVAAVTGHIDLLCAADVLYDPDNLQLAEDFLDRAGTVLLADSRVPCFEVAGYAPIATRLGVTEPDLGELDTVKRVRLYRGGGHPVRVVADGKQ
ncbi:MAG: protein methyltransferase [Porticoccaceae bacterium]|jgi:predicted nicotinamide N-methyase|nr:protein methyltransferase [Porticoccaceae bacterium]